MRSEISRNQVTKAWGCPGEGGEIFILTAKGSHCLAGSRVGNLATLLGPRKVSSSQTQHFREGVGWEPSEYLFSDIARVRMPRGPKDSRSLMPSKGQERPSDAAETHSPKTLRSQDNTLPSLLLDWQGLCQDPDRWGSLLWNITKWILKLPSEMAHHFCPHFIGQSKSGPHLTRKRGKGDTILPDAWKVERWDYLGQH